MRATWVIAVLIANIAILGGTQALGQQACKPKMMFVEVRYSPMQLPKLQRTWTAVLSVDASQCQTLSGRFEIVFSMEKENAPDYEVREELTWLPGSMKVSKEFWIDEAVAAYRVDNIACACSKYQASPPLEARNGPAKASGGIDRPPPHVAVGWPRSAPLRAEMLQRQCNGEDSFPPHHPR